MVAELCDIVLILAKSQLFMLIIMGRKFHGHPSNIGCYNGKVVYQVKRMRSIPDAR